MATPDGPTQAREDSALPDPREPTAADLLPLIYGELRRLAAAKLYRATPGQTLQPTALVHEAWLRLGGDQQPDWVNRAQYFAAAAEAMRRIIIDNFRRKRAVRHGGDLIRIHTVSPLLEVADQADDDEEFFFINQAIDTLALEHARKAELVKQRYFCGLTLEEAAEVMNISFTTAKRDWAFARSWLFNEVKRLRGEPAAPPPE